jgi:protein-S-isoprenylcysteine O-methyltransferase Ste14
VGAKSVALAQFGNLSDIAWLRQLPAYSCRSRTLPHYRARIIHCESKIQSVPGYAYAVLAAGWAIWLTPFLLARRHHERARVIDRRARWGVLLVAVSYSMLWQNSFWARPLPAWRFVLSVCFLLSAIVLSWTGAHSLGRQWRVDAGLNQDHELIVSGPYRVVRHPIYTSMLCLLFGTGFMVTPLWLLLPAVIVFVVGTEIRIRIEDQLLSSRFAERFREYERSVPAYIPFLR